MPCRMTDNGIIGSLFTGYGGLDLGVMGALGGGMRVAYTSDIEPGPMAIEAYHARACGCPPNLGDITRMDLQALPDVDVICGGSPCFPAGALVLTACGFTPIENVKVGDLVLTHRNHWKRVLATGSHIGETIMLKGQGSSGVECTPNHPFWAGRRYRGPWDNGRRRYPTLFAVDGWTPAADMPGRMWLNMGANVPELPIPALENVTFNAEFFYFVGRFLGDGWLYENKKGYGKQVGVCCGFKDVETLAPHLEALGWKFSEQDQRTGHYWRCYDKVKFAWFKEHFGRGAANKTIPAWVFGMREDWRRALLEGYWDSDGDRTSSGLHATSVSRKLLLGVKMLEAGLGRASSLSKHEPSRAQCVIEGRVVNEKTNYMINSYDRSRKSILCDEGFWGHVHRIESGRSHVRVYDLTVEDDHSFTVDGIAVANCTDISVAGLRAGLREGTRSGLWSFQADAVAATRPSLLVWENVGAALTTAASSREDARERDRRASLLAAHGLCACDPPVLPDVDGFTPPKSVGEKPVDGAAALAVFLHHDVHRCASIRCAACGYRVFEVRRGRVLADRERLDGVHTMPVMRALGRVLGDLAALGYDAVWRGVEAAAVGAPHHRLRIFVAAWPHVPERVSGNRRLARLDALGPMREPDGLPFAVWDGERDVWTTGQPDLFDDMPVFMDAWPKAGVMVSGRVWRLNADDRTVDGLFASPKASDGEKGGPNQAYGAGGGPLPAMVAALPTPRTSDANGAGVHGDGGMDLHTQAVGLLPTPAASDGDKYGTTDANRLRANPMKRAVHLVDEIGTNTDVKSLLPTPSAEYDGGKAGGTAFSRRRREHGRQLGLSDIVNLGLSEE